MRPIVSFFSNIFAGNQKAYVYIWMSKEFQFLYVGQTNDKMGTFGRAYSHLGLGGTLRERCNERVGIDLDYMSDLYLFSFPLPSSPEFIGCETSFRLAVEYLVQFKLYDLRSELNPIFQIISNVTTTDRVSNNTVRALSDQIVSEFKEQYESIQYYQSITNTVFK